MGFVPARREFVRMLGTHLRRRDSLMGHRFRVDDVALALRLMTGYDHSDTMKDGIASLEDLISKSFKYQKDKAVVPLANLLDLPTKSKDDVLIVERERVVNIHDGRGGEWKYTIGVFADTDAAEGSEVSPAYKVAGCSDSFRGDFVQLLEKMAAQFSKKRQTRDDGQQSGAKKKARKKSVTPQTPQEELDEAHRLAADAAMSLKKALAAIETAEKRLGDDGDKAECTKEIPSYEKNQEECTSVLNYIIDGRAGTLRVNPQSFVCVQDLINCREELLYQDSDEMEKERHGTRFHMETAGAVQVMVPNRFTLVPTHHLSRYKKNSEMIKRLRKLFNGQRCKIKWPSFRFVPAYALHSLGVSMEGVQMILAASWRCLFSEMGFTVSNGDLGRGCPSQEMIRVAFIKFSAECFLARCQQLVDNSIHQAALLQDAGHKNNLDHHCKVLVYAVVDDKGRKTIERFCIDVDPCGGTAEEICQALKRSIDRVKTRVPDLKIIGITGDSGGGGKVQGLFDRLVELDVIDKEWGRFVRCLLHALNKCIENASKFTFGEQGLGNVCAAQLLYNAVTLFKKVKKVGGLELLDIQFNQVIEKLNDDEDWRLEAETSSPSAFAERAANRAASRAASLDDLDAGDFEGGARPLEEQNGGADTGSSSAPGGGEKKAPRGVQMPNWMRWNSMLPAARLVLELWLEFRFLAVANRQSQKNGNSYMSQVSDSLLAAMNVKAPRAVSDVEGADNYDPSIYIQLLLLVAFADELFDDFFHEAMAPDPEYGAASHGQTSRRWSVFTFLLKKNLDELQKIVERKKDGHVVNLEDRPSLARYYKAAERVPPCGGRVANGGREYFMEAPVTFIRYFRLSFKEHVESVWTSDRILVFAIGDHPILAQWLLKLLHHVIDSLETVENFAYPPPDLTVNLKYRLRSKQEVEVNVREFLEYLTANADFKAIASDPFISENTELLWKMASASDPVDLHDKSTWGAEDYSPVAKLIHRVAVAVSSQGQMIENYVQAAGRASRNNRGETTSSALAVGNSLVIRSYNAKSREEKRDKVREKTDDDAAVQKVRRVKDQERIEGFGNHLDGILESIGIVRDGMTITDFNDFVADYSSKISKNELEAEKNRFDEGINKRRRVTAKESLAANVTITAAMGGKFPIAKITKSRNHKDHMQSEISARGISLPKEFEEMYDREWDDLKNLLRLHEFSRLEAAGQKPEKIVKWSQVNEIVPQSELMQEAMDTYMEEEATKS